jgi:protein CpxP
MRNKVVAFTLGGLLALGAQAAVFAKDNPQTQPSQDQAQGQTQGQYGHGRRGMMNPDRQLEHMTKVLNLSADQQAQIKPILQDRQQKMQALWQDQSVARQDRRAKAQAIQKDTRSRIEAVLNDQQKQQFESMRQRGPRGGGNPQNASPENSTPQPN